LDRVYSFVELRCVGYAALHRSSPKRSGTTAIPALKGVSTNVCGHQYPCRAADAQTFALPIPPLIVGKEARAPPIGP